MVLSVPETFGPPNPFKHNSETGNFSEISKAYEANPTIKSYVDLRRKYPNALIEISTNHGMHWLYSNSEILEGYQIDPLLVAGALDADENSICELSLLLLENLVFRNKLKATGQAHVQSHEGVIADSLINYLISMMLDAMDWNNWLFVPRDLMVLIKYQCEGDVSAVARKQVVRNQMNSAAWIAAEIRENGRRGSLRDVAKIMGVNPSTVLRWFENSSFEEEVKLAISMLKTSREISARRQNRCPQ